MTVLKTCEVSSPTPTASTPQPRCLMRMVLIAVCVRHSAMVARSCDDVSPQPDSSPRSAIDTSSSGAPTARSRASRRVVQSCAWLTIIQPRSRSTETSMSPPTAIPMRMASHTNRPATAAAWVEFRDPPAASRWSARAMAGVEADPRKLNTWQNGGERERERFVNADLLWVR